MLYNKHHIKRYEKYLVMSKSDYTKYIFSMVQ